MKKIVDPETGETIEGYDSEKEEAIVAHFDFAMQVNWLVNNRARALALMVQEDCDCIGYFGLPQDVCEESIKRILGKSDYKKFSWTDFLKRK